jgi:hypothetical protein
MCGRQGIISLFLCKVWELEEWLRILDPVYISLFLCKVWELEEWLRILDLSANRLNSLPDKISSLRCKP